MTSPTARTLAELRRRGLMAAVVERWNPHARVRHDLFGLVDVLGVGPPLEELEGMPPDPRPLVTLAVQATSSSNVAARVAKLNGVGLEGEELAELLERRGRLWAAGWVLEVWGWRKSARTRRWELRRVRV